MAADTPIEPGKSLVASSDSLPTPDSKHLAGIGQLASTTDQSQAVAGGDMVGRDKTTATFNYIAPASAPTAQPKIIAELMEIAT